MNNINNSSYPNCENVRIHVSRKMVCEQTSSHDKVNPYYAYRFKAYDKNGKLIPDYILPVIMLMTYDEEKGIATDFNGHTYPIEEYDESEDNP